MKANDNLMTDKVILPIPELHTTTREEMEIYARFMRHLRYVPNSRMDIKILSSIHYVADMLQLSDSDVTRTLIEMGLRTPRSALPDDYLDHVDNALIREVWEIGSANQSVRELRDHWLKIGEDKLAGFRRHYPTLSEEIFIRV